MRTYANSEAGIATFQEGRSLCVRLHGRLDVSMALTAATRLRLDRTAVRLRLECSSLRAAELEGARLLASAVLSWCHARSDRAVDILNLSGTVEGSAAWHPLRTFTYDGESLFFDPDREPPWLGEPRVRGAA